MMTDMLRSLRFAVVTLLLTGILYPVVVTGIAQVVFPRQAAGSLVQDESGKVVGSSLIGQRFRNPGYFQPRPSAAGKDGYDGLSSGGSNYGQTSATLKDRVTAEIERLKKENPAAPSRIPVELVTTSASGLDPHLSPAGAFWQIPRVAAARGVDPARIQSVVESLTEGPDLGIFGQARVAVLPLNLALDRRFGRPDNPIPASGGH